MEITELIAQLEDIRKICGDIPVQINLYDSHDVEFVKYDVEFATAEGIDEKGTKIALLHIG